MPDNRAKTLKPASDKGKPDLTLFQGSSGRAVVLLFTGLYLSA